MPVVRVVVLRLVSEEIANALVLHQAADEGKVGFIVLHAIVADGGRAEELEDDRELPVIDEDLVEDVGHAPVLEDATLVAEGEPP